MKRGEANRVLEPIGPGASSGHWAASMRCSSGEEGIEPPSRRTEGGRILAATGRAPPSRGSSGKIAPQDEASRRRALKYSIRGDCFCRFPNPNLHVAFPAGVRCRATTIACCRYPVSKTTRATRRGPMPFHSKTRVCWRAGISTSANRWRRAEAGHLGR